MRARIDGKEYMRQASLVGKIVRRRQHASRLRVLLELKGEWRCRVVRGRPLVDFSVGLFGYFCMESVGDYGETVSASVDQPVVACSVRTKSTNLRSPFELTSRVLCSTLVGCPLFAPHTIQAPFPAAYPWRHVVSVPLPPAHHPAACSLQVVSRSPRSLRLKHSLDDG